VQISEINIHWSRNTLNLKIGDRFIKKPFFSAEGNQNKLQNFLLCIFQKLTICNIMDYGIRLVYSGSILEEQLEISTTAFNDCETKIAELQKQYNDTEPKLERKTKQRLKQNVRQDRYH